MAFTCNLCPSTFTEATSLSRHIRTQHGNTTYQCERCVFTTKRKDKLKQHIESKHYKNTFKCLHCTFECARKDNLTRHINAYHEVPVNPLAPTPDFDWADDVEQEERTQKEVTFRCDQCTSTFGERKNLNRHISSVHEEEKFQCAQCAQIFNRQDHLNRHLPVHKKVKKTAPAPKYELFDEPSDSQKSCFGEKI